MVWVAAFLEGMLSCLSPCVLPLLPGYISALVTAVDDSGAAEGGDGGPAPGPSGEGRLPRTGGVLFPTLLFVAGVGFTFTLFGLGATTVGRFFDAYRAHAERAAAGIIALFGLHLLGLVRAPRALEREARPLYAIASGRKGRAAIFLLGVAFAAGWTPCVGPILGSVLAMAATAESAWRGAGLLFVYSMGLGFPFVALAAAFQWGKGATVWNLGRRGAGVAKAAKVGAGALLVVFGIGMLFGFWGGMP